MNNYHQQFIEDLSNTRPDVTALYQLMDKYDGIEDIEPLFDPILKFMEKHQSEDLGCPGPLVHFIEQAYPAYLENLKSSIERKPTQLTVWMLNRILNSNLDSALREELTSLMSNIEKHPLADDDAKSQAKEFTEHQQNN